VENAPLVYYYKRLTGTEMYGIFIRKEKSMAVKKRAKWGSKTRKCTSCGKSNPTKVRFCRVCGKNPRSEPNPEPNPEPKKITPKVLAKPQTEPKLESKAAFSEPSARGLVREGLVSLSLGLQDELQIIQGKLEEVDRLLAREHEENSSRPSRR